MQDQKAATNERRTNVTLKKPVRLYTKKLKKTNYYQMKRYADLQSPVEAIQLECRKKYLQPKQTEARTTIKPNG